MTQQTPVVVINQKVFKTLSREVKAMALVAQSSGLLVIQPEEDQS